MIKITGNEPAMPIIEDYNRGGIQVAEMSQPGLTIRQQFAAMAMQSLITIWTEGTGDRIHEGVIVADAVKIADALINELNKQPK